MTGNEAAFPEPPAFVGPNGEVSTCQQNGLTKREYFAAMSMQGLRAGAVITGEIVAGGVKLWSNEQVATQARYDADALIAELSKP